MSDFLVSYRAVRNADNQLTLLKLAPPSDTYLPKMKKEINVTNWKTLNLAFSIKKKLPLLSWAAQVRSKKRQVAKTFILWKEIEDLLGSRWYYNEERSDSHFMPESIAIKFSVDDNQSRNRRWGKSCTYGSIARSYSCHHKLAKRR